MKHDDAKDDAIQLAAWLHFEGSPAVQVVEAAINRYASLMETDQEGEQPAPEPEPKPEPPTVPPEPKPSEPPEPGGGFDKKFFEIIDHRGKPDLRTFGLEPLKIWYEGAFFDSKDRDADVNNSKVGSAAGNSPLISCPDIERWADKNTWRVSQANVQRYIEFCKTYRRNLPTSVHKFGLYSILPVRNYFDASGEKGPKGFNKWQGWNDEVAPIAEHVDMLFPSIYTFSSVFENKADRFQKWTRYAVANIQAAKRIAPGKPVYPFIWPWYHPKADRSLDPQFWRVQMEVCTKYADGFVIWDDLTKTKGDWNNLPRWWDETVDFLERNGASAAD